MLCLLPQWRKPVSRISGGALTAAGLVPGPPLQATPRVAAAPACVAAMEADGAEGMDVDGEDAPALPPPKASAGRRQFRSR
mmetsp:Transcript_8144/g.20781  ORF Transcript_8144/g.20781 Transcript_8144/m.20781 type:complete len:81 (+) Transcript_8144:144-386(+)